MARYDYRCSPCGVTVEIERPMAAQEGTYQCPECRRVMSRIYEFPHVELNWKAFDRNDTGSERMVLRAAKQGVRSAIDDSTEKGAIVHDDVRQESR